MRLNRTRSLRNRVSHRFFAGVRAAALTLCVALLGACQGTLFGTLGVAGRSNRVELRQGIVFDDTSRLALDVYRPGNAVHAPVVVFFYGGTWKDGERAWYRFVGEALAGCGLVVIIPDYRKYPQVKFPQFVDDAARAVRWAYDHAGEFNGDSHKLFLMGHSAGAHIAALLATDVRYLAEVNLRPHDLSGFIGLAGPYDFAPTQDPDLTPIFGDTDAEQELAQPVNFVRGDGPPMLLLHGESDTTVAVANSKKLAEKARSLGESEQLVLYPRIGHIRLLLSLSPLFLRWSPALHDSVEFIRSKSGTVGTSNPASQ
jgi:acetyl esterase/lipase